MEGSGFKLQIYHAKAGNGQAKQKIVDGEFMEHM